MITFQSARPKGRSGPPPAAAPATYSAEQNRPGGVAARPARADARHHQKKDHIQPFDPAGNLNFFWRGAAKTPCQSPGQHLPTGASSLLPQESDPPGFSAAAPAHQTRTTDQHGHRYTQSAAGCEPVALERFKYPETDSFPAEKNAGFRVRQTGNSTPEKAA